MKPVIVVVGATGQQGGSVINALINSNRWTVRGLSRNISSEGSQKLIANGVQMISCNIDCFDECVEAFKDAYGVFAMTNYWECGMTKEYEQGMNMVNAATQQGVKHFIWSSLPDTKAISNGQLDLPHYMSKARVESYIRSQQNPSLFPYTTFIYVGFYYQNFQTFFQPTSDFEFRVSLQPTGRLPLYDVRDTGPVVSQCFEHPERWGQGNIVPLVAKRLTMDEVCETIRCVTGNKYIRYIPLTYEQCVGQTKEAIDNMRWYNEYGDVEERHAEKTTEVYNQMKTLAEWIQETKWLIDEKK
ncbi:unnamed protein product [Rotaria magnacalcarata]|uniref:NmrA-like family domain-containing protein 1 n=2 Tax=Rotaria magnacalcarata TaxID=392030 RepID=A0A816UID2_9BILA|nr:unnamed protein product [Rotaria magnacalcarata]CAF4184190.1 unnamed protein product [Rotaria magnacalcarata]